MILDGVLLQLEGADTAANILFDRGVLGVVVFALFGMLMWVYRDKNNKEESHRQDMKDLLALYQEQTINMAKVVEQSTTTMQTLINTLQLAEVVEETVKDAVKDMMRDVQNT